MQSFRDALVAKAFREIPGEAYNRILGELMADEAPIIYEVVVPEAGPWEDFREAAYPPLARYLKSRRIDPEDPRGVVISAFLGNRCFFLEAPAFLDILREMDGLNGSALHFRVLRWLAG